MTFPNFQRHPLARLLALAPLMTATIVMAQEAKPLYRQADAPVDRRVEDLLSRMTLDEKIAQLITRTTLPLPLPGVPLLADLITGDTINDVRAKTTLSNGVGGFAHWSFQPMTPAQLAEQQNLIQAWLVNNTRLGIPTMFKAEALHGLAIRGGTIYPQAIALGSTWDRPLIRKMFTAIGKEARAAGITQVLAPVFDLARDPRYGRTEEMYSEDPYLVGELGTQAVLGLQGDGPTIDQDHVIATAKHFVHGQPENGTNVGPSDFSERTMRDTFLAPFEKAVKIGRIGGIMPSYNETMGGIPSHASSWLLKDVLRKEWGFVGFTDSDWFAVGMLNQTHGIAADARAAGVLALKSGLDMESPVPVGFGSLADAVRAGEVSEQDITTAARHVLTAKFRVGLFEQPYADPKRAAAVVGSAVTIPLARKVADEAIVLLKNEGSLLPLDPERITSLAVIGPNADKVRLGGYSAKPPYAITARQGIERRLGAKVKVSYAEGVRISEPDLDAESNKLAPYEAPLKARDAQLIAQAVETARSAEVVVLVLGGNETETRESFAAGLIGPKAALGDTDDLELPGRQNDLVREIMKLGKPTVAVLLNGRAYAIQHLSNTVPAIVEGWYLGQESGNAVAGVLFGDVNPSGKLSVTIARNVGQLPVYYYKTPVARLGYVMNDNSPLYPFGYGLSYTTFSYGKPSLDTAKIARDGTARITVAVTNSGARAGDEVVQLYVRPKFSSVVQPVIRLIGFDRLDLKAGQTKKVSFAVGPEQLAIWDRDMKRTVEPGVFEISVGPSSADRQIVELEVIDPTAPKRTVSSAPVQALLSVETTPLGTILDNPAAKAVLIRHIPELASSEAVAGLAMARALPLRAIRQFKPDIITEAKLGGIEADLAKLPVPSN